MSRIKEIVMVGKRGSKEFISYETVSIDSYEAFGGEKALSHSFLMDSFRKIMGRTLTIIDASVLDKNQNKAMKDLVRGIFSDEMDFVAEIAYDQKELQKSIPDDFESSEEDAVTIEEALGVK